MDKFITTPFINVKNVNTEAFRLRNSTLKKIKKNFLHLNKKKVQFKDLLCDLINFNLLSKFNVIEDVIYFKIKFQEKKNL